jgi:outer membrane receptor protein involved in Fe transport
MELTDAHINNNVPAGPGSTGNVTLVVNAAGIENTGIELEGTFAITDSFTVGASLASYDNKFLPGSFQGGVFDADTNTFGGDDVSGTRPNNAPEETYAIYGEYIVALGNGSSLRFRADLRHRGDVWQRAGPDVRDGLNIAGTRPMFLRPELDKLGAHISWTSASENLTIAFWGRNLDNEMDFLNSGPGIGSIFNKGQVGPLGLDAQRSRPVGVAGREQMGVTASFSF